jgi:uncharacterized membrane protein YphA (DoxX/SURF4 family)
VESESDATPARETPAPWNLATRVGFRFAFAFFVLRFAPFPFDRLPVLDRLAGFYYRGMSGIVSFLGVHVLRVAETASFGGTGSGDRTADWRELGCHVLLAAVATLVWSVADRRRRSYARQYELLRVYLRYYLAMAMLQYGTSKLFLNQFPAPPSFYLLETYGESSPMRLLWTFMGASPSYEMFGGLVEVTGAALLVFRRTTTAGALLLAGVLTNVVLLNFSYDVSVKILSSTLLLAAVFLLAPDGRRLVDVLLLNHASAPRPLGSIATSAWGTFAARAAKVVLVALVVIATSYRANATARDRLAVARSPIAGLYDAASAGSPDGARRWTAVEITSAFFFVRRADGSRDRFLLSHFDEATRALAIADRFRGEPGAPTYTLTAISREDGHLGLTGAMGSESVDVVLVRTEPPPFLLTTRGFHWVNEFPFNR